MYCNIINIHLHLFLCRCPPFLTAICSFFFDRSFCSLTLSAHIYEQGYQLPAQFFLNYDGPVKECDEFFSMFMLLNMLIGSYMRFNNWDMILVNYFAFNRIFFGGPSSFLTHVLIGSIYTQLLLMNPINPACFVATGQFS